MPVRNLNQHVRRLVVCLGTRILAALLLYVAMAIPASAQTFVVLHKFSGADGSHPDASLVQGLDGTFYGTTYQGGNGSRCPISGGCGTLFEIGRYGAVTTVHDFCSQSDCSDGASPNIGVIEGAYGELYGTTPLSGSNFTQASGTVFKISPTGALSNLYVFCSLANCADGAGPASLTLGWDGSFHGTTGGGVGPDESGSIFRLRPGGVLATTHVFCTAVVCDEYATSGFGLIQGADGNLYGVTGDTVFKTGPEGFSTLYDSCPEPCADPSRPSGLLQGVDGNLYGVTSNGGAYGKGSIFKLTTSGVLTTLYSFCATSDCPDGYLPYILLQATDGNFYGTTQSGGAYPTYGSVANLGTIFSFTPGGQFTTLHVFRGGDGNHPGGLTQGTDGAFYGTTLYGGKLAGQFGSALWNRVPPGLGSRSICASGSDIRQGRRPSHDSGKWFGECNCCQFQWNGSDFQSLLLRNGDRHHST
jgi:uncharacterized repeat protein (TIGR03803 family)